MGLTEIHQIRKTAMIGCFGDKPREIIDQWKKYKKIKKYVMTLNKEQTVMKTKNLKKDTATNRCIRFVVLTHEGSRNRRQNNNNER